MLHRNVGVFGALGLVGLGCAKAEKQGGDSGEAKGAAAPGTVAPTMATKVGETGGMRTPESVRYDPELDLFYVSNINGSPSQHDGNG
ncbi:MAG TPA: hypothetical protein VKP00_06225, partial [Gemmatimonadaceae bacterium]|nr:hypothetical protein [Gemmatimonadaceae bacterium]